MRSINQTLSDKYLEGDRERMGFMIWCIVSIFVLLAMEVILKDGATALVLTVGNVMMTLAIEFANYTIHNRDLKEGIIEVSKGAEGYEFFSLKMAFTPLLMLVFFVCIALLASYRSFIEDRLFGGFKK